jgi:hypothetical protein
MPNTNNALQQALDQGRKIEWVIYRNGKGSIVRIV